MKERFYGDFMSETKFSLLAIAVLIGFMFLIMMGVNSCSSTQWNNGTCPDCEVRYELRGASRGLKYYACPNCGGEVERY